MSKLLWILPLFLATCATNSGPFIPDTTYRVPPPSARVGTNADDVFMRAPWEIWQVPTGKARYHREALVLLPDDAKTFKAQEVSVYAADGSDVRIDYASIDLGKGSQSHESVSVFVYRATSDIGGEWNTAVARMRRQWPAGTTTEPWPIPDGHPATMKQLAMTTQGPGGTAFFVQTSLFRQGAWAIRYEISCPLHDLSVARKGTLAFLQSLRVEK